jgi:beta-glucosidase
MGWPMDPDGLETEIALLAERYGKPIVITENGIADRTDRKRQRFILEHLLAIRRAIEKGYDVRGYFHWSLIDNYEWSHGYTQKFGLFEMAQFSRGLLARPSAHLYRDLIAGDFVNPAAQAGTVP